MKVTCVKFHFKRPTQSESVIANCDITLDNALILSGLKFCKRQDGKGYILNMPRHKGENNKYYTYSFFINNKLRDEVLEDVVNAYECRRAKGLWKE